MNQQEAATGNQFAPSSPPANATPEELALWLADTRTRAHRLIDESVTAAQEMLNKRVTSIDEGDATAQAQRHAQRLAIERLRRAIGDLTLEVRGVHGRLDRLESLIRATLETSAARTEADQPLVAPRLAPRNAPVAVPESMPEVTPSLPAAAVLATAAAPAAPDMPRASLDAPIAAPEPVEVTPTPAVERAAPAPAAEQEAASTAGFAADARAAVEAAVASALQEARRAASLRAVPLQAEEEPDLAAAAHEERLEPAAPEREVAAPIAQLEEPAPLAPASPPAASAPPVEITEPAPEAPAEPAARPSLWVPPSAIAPRRPEPVPADRPAEDTRPVVAASLPASAVPPAPSGAAAAAVATPVAPAIAPPVPASPVTSPFEGNPAAAAAAAAAVSRFAAATATATTERLAPGTFGPDGGPIVLRIAPISGFQGLMRVQDAVVQHSPVREATVEAYARGEARLRLQLASPLEAEELSTALSRSLGLQARVETISDDERSIQVTLA